MGGMAFGELHFMGNYICEYIVQIIRLDEILFKSYLSPCLGVNRRQ
jgi:hypothetical protein